MAHRSSIRLALLVTVSVEDHSQPGEPAAQTQDEDAIRTAVFEQLDGVVIEQVQDDGRDVATDYKVFVNATMFADRETRTYFGDRTTVVEAEVLNGTS